MVPAPSRPSAPALPPALAPALAPAARRTSRRAVVAAPAALVAVPLLAACDGDPGTPDGVVTATEDGTSADVERVDEAVAAIGTARDLAATARATHATLAPALTPLLDVHDVHLGLLAEAAGSGDRTDDTGAPTGAGTTEGAGTPADPVLDPAAALAEVRTAENDLAATLTELAVAADSGPLARTLAAMAAAVDQQLLLLARASA